MNRTDDQLDRLFRAAAQVRAETVAPAFGLETRALAAWRDSLNGERGFWDMAVLVRGLIVAGVIVAISFWPVVNSSASNPESEYLQLTDSTVSSDVTP